MSHGVNELVRGVSEKLPSTSNSERGLHPVTSEPIFKITPPQAARVESDPALIDDFVQLLTKPPYHLARELIILSFEVDHAEILCDAIVNLFLATESFFDLLETFIDLEIEELGEHSEATLFQNRSPVAQLLLSIFRRTCDKYRKHLLQEKMQYLLDPEQAKMDLDIDQTGKKLSNVIKQFDEQINDLVNRLTSSSKYIPPIVQQQLSVLYSTVEAELPGFGIEAATSVFFFHFIYPSLVHPSTWIPELTASRRKRQELSALGKGLLYLATQSEPLNSMNAINLVLTEERQQAIRKFMETITSKPEAVQGNSFSALGIKNSRSTLNDSARTIKQFTGSHMSTLWRRVILHPEIARGFFPFIRSGFDNLCNKIKSDK